MRKMKKIYFLALTAVLSLWSLSLQAQYCTPQYGSSSSPSSGDYIDGVQLNGISNLFTGGLSAASYTNYSTVFSTSLQRGSFNQVLLLRGTVSTTRYGVWIDYDQNNVFSNTGEFLGEITMGSQTSAFINFSVPTGATLGTTRMRVRAVNASAGTLDPCGFYSFGETEDYGINITSVGSYCVPNYSIGTGSNDYINFVALGSIANTTGASAAPYYNYYPTPVATLNVSGNYTVTVQSGTYPTDNYAVWIDFNGDGDFYDAGEDIGAQSTTTASQTLTFPFQVPVGAVSGTTRMRVLCNYGQTTTDPCANFTYGETEDYNVAISVTSSGYCAPNPTNGTNFNDYINGVQMGPIQNTNSGAQGGPSYTYFTSPVCTLTANVSQSLTITGGADPADVYAAWIDYNDDGDFADVGEKIYEAQATAGFQSFLTNFVPPPSLINGATVMRVRCVYNTTSLDPCLDYTYGETEDYNVFLQGGSNGQSYCTPVHGTACSTTDNISNFYIAGTSLTNLNSGCTNLSGQAYNLYPVSGNFTTQLLRGNTYSFTMSSAGTSIMSIWVDFNQNGVFETTEWNQFTTSSVPNQLYTVNITVPANAAIGLTGIRIRSRASGSPNAAVDACTQFFSGETEDYFISIADPAGLPPIANFTAAVGTTGIDFTDDSQNSPTSWFWIFQGANPSTSTDQNPFGVTYSTPGCYDVTLIVANQFGTDTIYVPCFVSVTDNSYCQELFISEYVEGTVNNKAIEIYNPNNFTVPLSGYQLAVYNNGASVPLGYISLSGAIAAHDVYVVSHPSATETGITLNSNQSSTLLNFTGNDAIGLIKNSVVVDKIGVIAQDSLWLVGGVTWQDQTFVRNFSNSAPGTFWATTRLNYSPIGAFVYSGLGNHISACNPQGGACSITTVSCATPTQTANVGTGTIANGTSGYPSPYANFYKSGKSQFLYTAAELIAAGFTAGKINAISFNVIAVNGTSLYRDFTIKIGCTGLSSFNTGSMIQNLLQVFDPKDVNLTVGFNQHNFDRYFVWDGTSNLIVETCFNNLADANYTFNSSVPYTDLGVGRCQYEDSDTQNMCPLQAATVLTQRSNIRFHFCTTPAGNPPVANFQVNTSTICAGQCVSFTDLSTNSPTSWSWSFPGATSTTSNLQNPGNICYNQTGTYLVSLTVTNPFGSNTLTLQGYINVVAPPTALVTPNVSTICQGGSVQLFAQGGNSYVWTPPAGLSNSFIANPIASPTQSTTYLVSVSNGVCSSTASAIVNVNNVNASAGSDVTICPGGSTQLNATGGSSYSWSPSTGLSNPNIANPVANPTVTTTYTVTVTSNNCTATDQVNVIVQPIVANAGQDQSICAGETAQLNATGGTTYSWSPAAGLSNPNIANPLATPSVTTTYTVTVSNGNCSSTDVVVVNVTTLNGTAGSDLSTCPGGSVQLNATGGQIYDWTPPIFLSNPNIANPICTPTSTVTYTVFISDGNCSTSDNVTVTVTPLVVDAGQNQTICPGGSVQLNATGGTSYAWSPSAGLSNPNIANPIASPSSTTTYTVTVTSGNCTATDFVTVNVGTLVANAGNDVTICGGASTQLNASGGTSYSWSPTIGLSNPNIANPTANPNTTTTYTVTVTNGNCSSTDQVVVTVNNVTANAGQDQTICEGASVQLNATGGATYFWSPPNGLSSVTVPNPIANPTTTTTYMVTISSNGCTASDMVVVNVINVSANAGPDVIICAGSSMMLNGVGSGSSYLWSPPTGLSNPNIINPIAFPSQTTTYTLMVMSGNCSATDQVTVTVNSFTATASTDVTICAGAQTQISVSPGTAGASVQWSPTNGLANPTALSTTAFPTTTTLYTVVVTDPSGCTSSDQVLVTVLNVTASASQDQTICEGASVQLQASGGAVYSWSPAAGLNSSSIPNPIASPSQTTTYTVTVSVGNCSATDQVTVTVNNVQANAGPDQNICSGETVQLQANGGSNYSWTPTAGLSNPQIANPLASPAQTTTYYVTVTNGNCVDVDTVIVNVNNVVANAGNDVTICIGSSIQLNASGGTSYLWSPAVALSNPAIANPIAAPTSTLAYYVAVTDGNCSATDTVLVTVVPGIINLTASNDTAICSGTSVQLNANGGTSYEWSPATGLSNPFIANPIASPTQTTTYSVTASNGVCAESEQVVITVNSVFVTAGPDLSICTGANTVLLATGAANYSWSPTIGLNDPNVQNPLASPTQTTTYIVTGTIGSCSATDTMVVTVNTVSANAGADVTLCLGSSVGLNASGGTSYVWTPSAGLSDPNIANPLANPTATTTYTVTVTEGNCSATDQVIVNTSNGLFNFTVSGGGSICLGDSIALLASGANSYSWSPTQGLNDAFLANPMASPAQTTVYTVTGTDGICSQSQQLTVNVNSVVANVSSDTSICEGNSVALIATGGSNYSWSPSIGLSNPNAANPLATPAQTTTYTVIVEDGGCTDTALVTISVNNILLNTISDQSICEGDSVQLFTSGAQNYNWFPATGLSNPNIANPMANPTVSTVYYITATSGLCSIVDTVLVTVNPLPAVPVITMISPDLYSSIADTYQWSLNGNTIGGATFQSIFPNQIGDYTVTVTNTYGCSATSLPYQILTVSMSEMNNHFNIQLFPNPASDQLIITLPEGLNENIAVLIFDASGKLIHQDNWSGLPTGSTQKIQLSDWADGLYLVRFKGDSFSQTARIIKN
jgi:PKD repeat protein